MSPFSTTFSASKTAPPHLGHAGWHLVGKDDDDDDGLISVVSGYVCGRSYLRK